MDLEPEAAEDLTVEDDLAAEDTPEARDTVEALWAVEPELLLTGCSDEVPRLWVFILETELLDLRTVDDDGVPYLEEVPSPVRALPELLRAAVALLGVKWALPYQ